MSFFNIMKRIAQGKPAFDPEDESGFHEPSQTPPAENPTPNEPIAPAGPAATIQKGNDHTYPVVAITRTATRVNGSNMQVYCRIRNMWLGEIEVDKIRLLSSTREIDTYLRPNEEKEVLVYSGSKPSHDHHHEAELEYRTKDGGDYFRAIYKIGYHPQADKSFIIDEFHLEHPIRDIYG